MSTREQEDGCQAVHSLDNLVEEIALNEITDTRQIRTHPIVVHHLAVVYYHNIARLNNIIIRV